MTPPLQIEYFRPISGYRVSNCGRVLTPHGKECKQRSLPKGYRLVTLTLNGKMVGVAVHRLVGMLFVDNDKPLLNNQINHINGCPADNNASNLEWTDCAGNIRERIAYRARHGLPRFTPAELAAQKLAIERTGKRISFGGRVFPSLGEASRQLGIKRSKLRRGLAKGRFRGLPLEEVA